MKLKFLGVVLLSICLMSSTVFATYNWMQADDSTPQYAATDNWTEPNQWDTDAHAPPTLNRGWPQPPTPAAGEIKVITNTGTNGPAHCTINSNIGSYTVNTSVNGTLYINGSANIGFNRSSSVTGKNGLRVGSANAGGTSNPPTGTVEQSAGTVTATMVYLGYAGGNGPATGYYIISGGSLTCSSGLAVGTGINASGAQQTIGKFTVDGNSSTISVTALRVGGQDLPGGTNSGTLEFKLGSTVSAIGCTSVDLDAGGANSTTALIVSAVSTPSGNILLVKNTGSAIVGSFDTLNGGGAGSGAEGSTVVLGGNTYTLTYMYDSVSQTKGAARSGTYNDIALIPEPATLALLSIGLLAIRRKK